jgi:hypothetical protein
MPEIIKTDHSKKPCGLSFANSFSKHENRHKHIPHQLHHRDYAPGAVFKNLTSSLTFSARNYESN